MALSQIGFWLDEKEKREFEKNAKAIGLTPSMALKMFITKFNRDKGFSYPVNAKDTPPLPEAVEKAMLIAKAEELGLLADTSEQVTDFQALRQRWVHQ